MKIIPIPIEPMSLAFAQASSQTVHHIDRIKEIIATVGTQDVFECSNL